jgi:DNA-binding response OmpR family regulator
MRTTPDMPTATDLQTFDSAAVTEGAELFALVADDDPIVRRVLIIALTREGFTCEMAADGEQALDRLRGRAYDLLVTDLRMPNRNGHSLVVEVLKQDPRPVIIVHTAVEEPRLTKDLIVRGVDDVLYKPVNHAIFGAKARALVERRRTRAARQTEKRHIERGEATAPRKAADRLAPTGCPQIPFREVSRRLAEVEMLFPLSHVAFEVYSMARQDADADDLAACVEQDASLTAEVLQLANSA